MSSIDQSNFLAHFATLTGGSLEEGKAWHSDKVVLKYQTFKIAVDYYTLWSGKYSQVFTRIVSEVNSLDNFSFSIRSQDMLSNIEKLFGAQDVEVGKPKFDNAFMIKSTNDFKIRTLLQNVNLQNLLLREKDVILELSKYNAILKSELDSDVSQLSVYVEEEVKNVEKLNSLLNVFQQILTELQLRKFIT